MKGASYLDIGELIQLTSKQVVKIIQENSVEEIRSLFNIRNDFSTEDVDKLAREIDFSLKANERFQ